MSEGTKKLLLELDAILDTRQAVLGGLDPRGTARLLSLPTYAYRYEDYFDGFDQKAYQEAYANRDARVLKNATLTPIIARVHEFTQRVHNKNLNAPNRLTAEIVINTYPYELPDSVKGMIKVAILLKLPLCPEISFVHLPVGKLNPYYIRTNFEAVILYHFNDWLKVFIEDENFAKYPCFHVTMFAPTLVKSSKNLEKDINIIDSFIKTMEFLQPMIGLFYLPVEEFCSLLAYRRPRSSTPKDAGSEQETTASNIPVPDFRMPDPPSPDI